MQYTFRPERSPSTTAECCDRMTAIRAEAVRRQAHADRGHREEAAPASVEKPPCCVQLLRHTERNCVDHQLELDRGLDGKLARLLALDDAIDIASGLTGEDRIVRPVAHEAAIRSEATEAASDGRHLVAGCCCSDRRRMDGGKDFGQYNEAGLLPPKQTDG